jgi:predicted nuclease of predicted toxin-antitoxin system
VRGHDACHLREEGLHRAPDIEIFTKAAAEQRVVLTFDLDFGEIAALSQGRKASVVLFRLHNPRTAHVIERLSAALSDCSAALERGAVVIVEESRHRIHLLPVGSPPD